MTAAFPPLTLRAEGLVCRRGALVLFEGLSLAVAAGETVALTGPNGAGKSTLLRLLALLSRPEAGRIRIEGLGAEDDPHLAMHYHGHRDGLSPALSARENLRFAARLGGAAADGIEPAIERLGIRRFADLPVRALSAGQRRRVALARLMLPPRPVWLVDEPLTALDSAAQGIVAGLLAGHREAGGLAIVATHQPIEGTTRAIALGAAA